MKTLLALTSFAALALGTVSAHAVPISGDMGTEGLGSFTGDLTFSATDDMNATLTVQLTNTSDAANGGFITGFVLNNPEDLITSVDLTSAFGDFELLGLDNDDVNGAPFGQFDFGAALGGSFQGGGNPNGGIGVGETGTFVFDLMGSNLLSLTEEDFLAELSVGPGIGEGAEEFVVRFRGFEDGGSDKVPVDSNGGETPVPAPAALGLFGLGVLGLSLARRRR